MSMLWLQNQFSLLCGVCGEMDEMVIMTKKSSHKGS